MANFVLVHGAWGGGQTYGEVPDRLRAAGHQVVVCALRGLGSRQGELHPGITLSDHVDDVCAQVAEQGFERFILAGHSYGGMVITGVATRLGARIDAICYLDAFLPLDDQSLWDITGGFEHAWYIDSQRHTPGLVAPIGSVDFAPVPGQVGFHPLLTLLEAIPFTGEEAKIARRAYVFASAWEPTPFRQFADRVREDAAWEYHDAATDHFVMGGAPEQVAQILLGLAES
jgi:pimeloyl-ACP methyl ester carboxylesterase